MIWLLIDSSSVGGAERHIETVAQSLARRQISTQIILYEDHGKNPWLDQLAASRMSVRILDGSPNALIKALRRNRPDLLHTHGYKAGILGRLAARLTGISVVSTFHSGERGSFPVSFYIWLDNWTSFLGRRVVVSEQIRQQIPFSSTHIPNFILVPDDTPGGPLPRRIGFVGRLSEEKAPDQFCLLAQRSNLDLEWHVYGDGPMRVELEEKYRDVVRFHGIVTDMAPVWSQLGLLVMPSRFEGLPLAALEALAAGVPVLASRVGALPSVVIDDLTGWLFERGDIDGALNGLDRWGCLDNAAQIQLRQSCLAHLEQNFSDTKWLPKLLDVYCRAGFKYQDGG